MIRVSDDRIDPNEVFAAIAKTDESNGHGAEILFLGRVRNINLGRAVNAVAYDAFAPLAEKTLATIAEEARGKWGQDLNVVILHRTGKLAVGEVSLAIGVSSRHRDESYVASRWIIEEIKERAPIWKKEFYTDGESDWLKGHALCGHGPRADVSTKASVGAEPSANHDHIHHHGHAHAHSESPAFSSETKE